jgi:alkylation response protein AidB-like acyl-CoA dehydrogenase
VRAITSPQGHYLCNLRDLEFNLFEVFDCRPYLDTAPFEGFDEASVRAVLREMAQLATGALAQSYVGSDRNPPAFDALRSSVSLDEDFKKSYRAYLDAEYFRMSLRPELGGTYAPRVLSWAIEEMLSGANPAISMYASGPSFAQMLWSVGTADQRRFAELAIEKSWAATMVLTEPDAGSDVGACRTRATSQPDGRWHITGVKRFITSADHDLSENIFHLVLARPDGAGPGTKGLSLFLVPKFMVDLPTGALTERNGVYVTNLEHKMGLKASATCELTFGDRHPAVGYLVGDTHDGIRQMFLLIEHVRMKIGAKAAAMLSSGYLNALEYAKSRVQGGPLDQMSDKTAARVAIVEHPDVRRSLMTQKAHAEGIRALVMFAAANQDAIAIAAAAGEVDQAAAAINDLILPVVKGYTAERAYDLLGSEVLPTFGGSGYLQDYPIEQYIRDIRVDALYEGTTAIQAIDLLFRKIVRDHGRAFSRLTAQIADFASAEPGSTPLARERRSLARALASVEAIVEQLRAWADDPLPGARGVHRAGLNATLLLFALGDLLVGWLLCRQAEIALVRLAGDLTPADRAFYTGKVAAARFFCATVLPRLSSDLMVVEGTTPDVMDVPVASL